MDFPYRWNIAIISLRNRYMGMFKIQVKIINPADSDKYFEEYFWIDTGALYSFIPEDRLKTIGLEPISSRNLIFADGRQEKRLFGEALFTIDELSETVTCPIIFAPVGSLYLLGATALENFGVDVDPTTKKLKPMFGIIGGFLSSK